MSQSPLPDDFYQKRDDYYQGTRPELLPFFPVSAKTVLDVGCGEGRFAKQLKDMHGATVWGVDISDESIAVANTLLDKAFVADVTASLDSLPDNYFDVIYFNDVLEHMIDPYTLLSNIQSKLTTQGKVIASIPNMRHFRVLWKLLAKKDFQYENAGVMDETHLRFFTKISMGRMFSEAGYQNVEVTPISKSRSFRPKFFKLFTLGLIGSDISYPQFVVTGNKPGTVA
ncbi:MAG: 2-polyprenyl-3-methyl-5-hydroxy-6-metoxy-1,4-benzoquinol methylase [Granulosicoccus sp.]|jgi:2-polyprenyl-3-methyl-5-hydroxy-6-metoxy-1,4-benzoquinol methylase